MPFTEARELVQTTGLKNTAAWREYCKSGQKPNNIPSSPNTVYKNEGWLDWGDWLGTGAVSSVKKSKRKNAKLDEANTKAASIIWDIVTNFLFIFCATIAYYKLWLILVAAQLIALIFCRPVFVPIFAAVATVVMTIVTIVIMRVKKP
jgi:hypothetical protein